MVGWRCEDTAGFVQCSMDWMHRESSSLDRGTALWKRNRSLELTSQDTGKIDYVGENVEQASAHVVTVESGRVTERIH